MKKAAATDPLAAARIALAAKREYDREHPPEKKPVQKLSYRVEELAAATGLSKNTIRRAIKRGDIRATMIGLTPVVPASEVQRLFG